MGLVNFNQSLTKEKIKRDALTVVVERLERGYTSQNVVIMNKPSIWKKKSFQYSITMLAMSFTLKWSSRNSKTSLRWCHMKTRLWNGSNICTDYIILLPYEMYKWERLSVRFFLFPCAYFKYLICAVCYCMDHFCSRLCSFKPKALQKKYFHSLSAVLTVAHNYRPKKTSEPV